MEVSVSSPHINLPEQIEKTARTKIGKLGRLMPDLETAVVRFKEARNPRISKSQTCEVTLSGKGHNLRCKVSASDQLGALDLAVDKLERQIRKLSTRLQRNRRGGRKTIRTAEDE